MRPHPSLLATKPHPLHHHSFLAYRVVSLSRCQIVLSCHASLTPYTAFSMPTLGVASPLKTLNTWGGSSWDWVSTGGLASGCGQANTGRGLPLLGGVTTSSSEQMGRPSTVHFNTGPDDDLSRKMVTRQQLCKVRIIAHPHPSPRGVTTHPFPPGPVAWT